MEEQGKTRFLLPLFSKKSSFLLSFFTSGVTLVTAKKQHRCWKARATRTRVSILPSLLPSLFTFAWVIAWLFPRFWVILFGEGSKTGCF